MIIRSLEIEHFGKFRNLSLNLNPGINILSGENEERELLRTVLQPGDTVLLCSDGVASEQDDGWIRERLQHAEGDGRQLAAAILDEAVKRYGRCDDMTVLALRLQEGGM